MMHSHTLTLVCRSFKQLQTEKEKAAAKIDGLEDEIDGLKGRLRKLQDKADREVRVNNLVYNKSCKSMLWADVRPGETRMKELRSIYRSGLTCNTHLSCALRVTSIFLNFLFLL